MGSLSVKVSSLSGRLSSINSAFRDRISRRADETAYAGIKRQLEEMNNEVSRLVLGFKFLETVPKVAPQKAGWQRLALSIHKIRELVGTWMESGRGMRLERLQKLGSDVSEDIRRLEKNMVTAFTDWSQSLRIRIEGLKAFRGLMVQSDARSLDELDEGVPRPPLDATDVYEHTGAGDDQLEQRVRKWRETVSSLSSLEDKVSDARIMKEFELSRVSMMLLKDLLKGTRVQLAEVEEQALLDLKRAKKLSKRISLAFGGGSD